ncbi:hypothetical protein [Arsenophonus nasoniae]|uniref:Uncharacterized protein n=1 Tax=Arsenophonus nasoniae TaxID=638 RepID=A0AA95H0Y3_9GAMM|nr:hypothetical protein [Arsenophonus nasoniae]WGM04067.1 hypothetical protein QE210_21715 [Arsenophonus nasoniae]
MVLHSDWYGDRANVQKKNYSRGGKISHGGGRPEGSIIVGSIEQRKPWTELGISRRTYYYRKQKGML